MDDPSKVIFKFQTILHVQALLNSNYNKIFLYLKGKKEQNSSHTNKKLIGAHGSHWETLGANGSSLEPLGANGSQMKRST